MLEPTNMADFATLARRGAEHAGETLSRWLRRPVQIKVSSVELVRLDQIAAPEGHGEDAAITLSARVQGELPGNAAVQLSPSDANALLVCLGGQIGGSVAAPELAEMERSMLQETANILFSSLMNNLASHLGLRAVPYAPQVLVDLGAAAWDGLLLECAEEADEAVVVTAQLCTIGDGPNMRLVFLPAPAALATVRERVSYDQR